MSLRDMNVRMPNGKRPYTDEEWAEVAMRRVVNSAYMPLGLSQKGWGEIHAVAFDVVAELERELALWQDLAEATDFTEAP